MQAFVLDAYRKPLRMGEMAVPQPGPREVIVKMVASGINHADERTRQGEFKAIFSLDLPKVMGGELSGEVIALGDDVREFSVGQQVYGYTGVTAMGTWAEFVAVDADSLALAPSNISLVEASALPVVALTAWQALVDIANLAPGQTVLIHGGAGGVGSAAIQLAKHLGATVVTTASAASFEELRGRGADIVIDYRNEDFVERLASTPVDVVIDTQGGDITTRSLNVLRPGGTVIGIAGTPEPSLVDQTGAPKFVKVVLAALSFRLRREAKKLGVNYKFLFIQPDGASLQTITRLVEADVIQPFVDRVLPFEKTLAALDQLLAGGVRGKVLVTTIPDEVTANG